MKSLIVGLAAGLLGASALLASALPASAACNDKRNRWITIVNDTERTIMYVYASNVGTSSWGRDKLNTDVIGPGESVDINAEDSSCRCMMDLRAESDGNTFWQRFNYNVCSRERWILRPN